MTQIEEYIIIELEQVGVTHECRFVDIYGGPTVHQFKYESVTADINIMDIVAFYHNKDLSEVDIISNVCDEIILALLNKLREQNKFEKFYDAEESNGVC